MIKEHLQNSPYVDGIFQSEDEAVSRVTPFSTPVNVSSVTLIHNN